MIYHNNEGARKLRRKHPRPDLTDPTLLAAGDAGAWPLFLEEMVDTETGESVAVLWAGAEGEESMTVVLEADQLAATRWEEMERRRRHWRPVRQSTYAAAWEYYMGERRGTHLEQVTFDPDKDEHVRFFASAGFAVFVKVADEEDRFMLAHPDDRVERRDHPLVAVVPLMADGAEFLALVEGDEQVFAMLWLEEQEAEENEWE